MAAATAQFYFRFRIGCRPTLQNVSLSANQTSECLNPRLRYNYFRFRKTSIRHIVFFFRFQFRPYDRNWHVILHQAAKFHLNRTILSIVMNLWCYKKIFKMTAATAQFYFRCRIGWRPSFQNVSRYQQTKRRRSVLISGWDITISGLEKQTFAILEFYFRFQLINYTTTNNNGFA